GALAHRRAGAQGPRRPLLDGARGHRRTGVSRSRRRHEPLARHAERGDRPVDQGAPVGAGAGHGSAGRSLSAPAPLTASHDPLEEAVRRPTIVEVDLTRLAENFRAIRAAVAPAAVMPIVKANAYGHGLVEVARHLVELGATSLGVAFLEEAIALR